MTVLAAATTMSDGLTNIATVLGDVVTQIEGNAILMTLFCGGLFVSGAKIFKHIKKAVR